MEDDKMLDLLEAAERLEAVAASLEQAGERLAQQQLELQQHVGPIVATVDEAATHPFLREQELERRLADAEAKLEQLSAHAAAVPAPSGRKTLAPGTATLLAKQGVAVDAMGSTGGMALEATALDSALASLSIEQRIAVKAELLRAGMLG